MARLDVGRGETHIGCAMLWLMDVVGSLGGLAAQGDAV